MLPTVKPRYTWAFLVANLVVFAVLTLAGGSENPVVLIGFGANFAPLVSAGEYWRLITANFIHIGVVHLLVNSYALYVVGQQVEALYGHARFVILYLLTGFSGAVASYLLTQGLSAGASTSLFGIFGALGVYFYRYRDLFGELSRQQLIQMGFTLLINIVLGFLPGSRIDNWGHLGGLIGGVVLGWFLCPRYRRTDPFLAAFQPALRQRAELANDYFTDANSLWRQLPAVLAFIAALVGLLAARRLL
ncbi:MAG: rhomboid family intramembrane serine protease [Thermoflexales bacterium]|nr:rhomboid family intramembrane serine protease [Thermoflexales bacterium]MCS7324196.1 rhomboid family intramembrane serine protease [Thermoflexales bacterium]MCX7938127.1 rhomboid family intramembrane serine protease [Thermoflexales bacterium]MDW8053658.1 rhomboid family intramembrane serine protease [Anaerolineae bacterium]MDW8293606.1 rhomboid family intramembrane serine protease [Anaerolineae bacterium]